MPPTYRGGRLIPRERLALTLPTTKPNIYTDTSLPTSSSSRTNSASATGPAAPIHSLAWSPLGTLVATADARVLRVWNPDKTHVKYSTELKLQPSSNNAASTTSATGSVVPGGPAAATGKPARQPQPQHIGNVERVAWNPAREAELASLGGDGTVRFWDVRARGAMVGEVKVGGDGYSLAWRPGGEELVVGRKDDTLVPISRGAMATIAEYPQPVQTNHIAFTNSGRELLLTTGDSHLKILDYPSMQVLHSINAHTSSCSTVAQCPRGRHIAVGGTDALVTLWDTTDFVCRHSLHDATGPIKSVSFSFDGSYVVGGTDEDSGIQVYHVETGESVCTIPTSTPASILAWHPSRYWIACNGESATLKIYGPGSSVLGG